MGAVDCRAEASTQRPSPAEFDHIEMVSCGYPRDLGEGHTNTAKDRD
jgi:hypothetical protein